MAEDGIPTTARIHARTLRTVLTGLAAISGYKLSDAEREAIIDAHNNVRRAESILHELSTRKATQPAAGGTGGFRVSRGLW